MAADPNGQVSALRRFRLHGHGGGGVERAAVVHLGIAPIGAQHFDGFVHALSAGVKVLLQGVVFGLLPTDPDAEPNAPARERVQGAHLLGHKHRLALRQHQHLGADANALRHRRDVRERHQRLQNRHLRRVNGRRTVRGGETHDDVVEHVQLIETDPLDGLGQADYSGTAFAVAHGRELDGQLHGFARGATPSARTTRGRCGDGMFKTGAARAKRLPPRGVVGGQPPDWLGKAPSQRSCPPTNDCT